MFIKETVKGMRDILPAEMEIREYLQSRLKNIYTSFGFTQIETPCMERIENLTNKQGGENEKLIFKVLKRGEKLSEADLTNPDELADSGMRYDLTVPLSRYYANNAGNLPMPFKALQVGSVWRADRPQKGRFRQFTQCDIDILGDPTNNAESELIYVTSLFLDSVGVSGNTVMINDRRVLKGMAKKSGFAEEEYSRVFIILDKYDKIGEDGVRAELLEAGYAEECVNAYMDLFHGFMNAEDRFTYAEEAFGDAMEEGVADNLRQIFNNVATMSDGRFKLSFDPTLVRGMSYYTGTIFEIKSDDFKGSSIAGGGRYDNMIGNFTGNPTCACGFSIGFERLVGALLEKNFKAPDGREKIAVLYGKSFESADVATVQNKCRQLREEGKIVLVQKMNKNVGFQKQKLEADGYTKFIDIRYPDQIDTAF
ncbi:MAG: histidine--tRNA ligase [Ruminococcaceae bacterium]|nr:histidine--tRNA ligase [Oscillospiraceae bacterium]